ncbi:MAG TPA: ELWxxDGT repeat protein, partial [Thermoanaerobaculia bacterium]|nr:ELWxxDGT repeat protein [Thermoanaerobaculia bacterium]
VSTDDDYVIRAETTVLNRILYFAGCNTAQGCGVWRSDGTPAGTFQLKQVDFAYNLAAAGNRLFFFEGSALWVTDGTPGGTLRVLDLPSGADLAAGMGNRLFFLSGGELWASDGTAVGTRPLTSFSAEQPFLQTRFLKALEGRLYFVADDVIHGAEIWSTDGTPSGTRQVTDIGFHDPFDWDETSSNQTGLRASDVEILGQRIVFWATDGIHGFQPWSATVSPGPTTPLCPDCSFQNNQAALAKVGSRLLFTGRNAQHGAEVWATDGTPAGTSLPREICPGTCDGATSEPTPLLGKAFFDGSQGQSRALWISDGTAAGTRRFAAPAASADYFGQLDLEALGSTVIFAGTGPQDDYGTELWASDGTPAGTRLVTDISRGRSSSSPGSLIPTERNLFFETCVSSSTLRLWYTEGTPDSTRLGDTSIACGGDPELVGSVNGALLFTVHEYFDQRDQLWRFDADGSATQITQMPQRSGIGESAVLGGRLYFAVRPTQDLETPEEIWQSDGTAQGTGKLAELPSGLHNPYFFTVVGPEIWFLADDFGQQGGSEIWRTDGTQAGTRKAADLGENRTVTDPEFTRIGSTVFFVGADEEDNRQIWKTDGTPAGAAQVTDLDPLGLYSDANPADLAALQGALYFSALTPDGIGFWRTDGTEQGTVLLKVFPSPEDYDGEYYPSPLDLTAVGPWLVFAVDSGVHGRAGGDNRALWRSDGTAAGTTLLRQIILRDSRDRGITDRFFRPAAGRLYFAADDGVHGTELWQTDGTAAGTRLVQDIAPEGASSFPADLTVAGDRLFFSADDGTTGRELWVLPLAGPPCQASASTLCLGGGRFEVKVSWRDFAGQTGSGRAVPLTGDTGYFWFFDPANVETVVKVLDGTGVNGHFWVFFGALTNVEYTLTVTDTQTGLTRRYFNPRGVFASVGDTQGFGPLGAYDTETRTDAGPLPRIAAPTETAAAASATSPCVPAANRLCLNGGRFAVEASWKDFSGHTGNGTAVPITGDTGYFWFFDSANVEAVVKVLDGTPVNGHFWLFYGALSNVEYRLTVTDTATGTVKVYSNPSGRFASVGDTTAF